MAKRRRNWGLLLATVDIKVHGGGRATPTFEMRTDELAQFLRHVARENMSDIPGLAQFLRHVAREDMGGNIPPGQLPEWSGYLLELLAGAPSGRPRKHAHPLWDAYENAKAGDPDLSKRKFVIRHCKLKRGDDAAIRKWMSQLRREEDGSPRRYHPLSIAPKLDELFVPEFLID